MAGKEFFYVTLIEASAEKVWQALTTAEFTRQYWHNTEVRSDWQVGSPVEFLVEGEVACEGRVLTCAPCRELSYTWRFPRNPACAGERPSTVQFLLEDLGGVTKLTVHHFDFLEQSATFEMVNAGWPYVLAGLKSLCETGRTRDFSALMAP